METHGACSPQFTPPTTCGVRERSNPSPGFSAYLMPARSGCRARLRADRAHAHSPQAVCYGSTGAADAMCVCFCASWAQRKDRRAWSRACCAARASSPAGGVTVVA
eukprot:6669246-Prymnesium_polylepis.1